MKKKFVNFLDKFKDFEQVKAIAIGGSSRAKTSDSLSDIDVYVFVSSDIPVSERDSLVKQFSSKFEVGGEYFGAGDEFWVDDLKIQLDVMYWNVNWFAQTVENIWEKHYPSNGYSTAFLFSLDNFEILYDKENWLKTLQDSIKTEYPQALQQNIIKRNLMLLKDKPFASYYEQIEKAISRNDVNSVNHRICAFLASYFDIIFAKNKLLHPGEKRLVDYCKKHCKILPEKFEENINNLLAQPNANTLAILEEMVVNLKNILK